MKKLWLPPDKLVSRFIIPAEMLIKEGYTESAMLLLTQSIEVMGAILDKKPVKARGQSKKRFALALRQLFPAGYSSRNIDDWLYENLRNHLAHSFTAGGMIKITILEKERLEHLEKKEKILTISLDVFMDDCKKAALKLERRIKSPAK